MRKTPLRLAFLLVLISWIPSVGQEAPARIPGRPVNTAAQLGQAQTFTLLYTFPGSNRGAYPGAGLTRDAKGNLYGTAGGGGAYGLGVAFKLDTTGVETSLHQFNGQSSDGAGPDSNLLWGSGNFYGTTYRGGEFNQGTVFELTPKGGGVWKETVLYSFTGSSDGAVLNPGLVRDAGGNLYGTTYEGGTFDQGTVFELTPSAGRWTETVLYNFNFETDAGAYPNPDLIMDVAGNLYGTTVDSGVSGGYGMIFKLAPPTLKRGPWSETVLYSFIGGTQGGAPQAGVIRDAAGNFYGTTGAFGDPTCSCGVVFKVDTTGKETVLHTFTGGTDGAYPRGLAFGSHRNLYGITLEGGGSTACNHGCGTIFEVNAAGTETVLYSFTGGTDGSLPNSGLIQDTAGNLYGTAQQGGADNRGTIFMITR